MLHRSRLITTVVLFVDRCVCVSMVDCGFFFAFCFRVQRVWGLSSTHRHRAPSFFSVRVSSFFLSNSRHRRYFRTGSRFFPLFLCCLAYVLLRIPASFLYRNALPLARRTNKQKQTEMKRLLSPFFLGKVPRLLVAIKGISR